MTFVCKGLVGVIEDARTTEVEQILARAFNQSSLDLRAAIVEATGQGLISVSFQHLSAQEYEAD